MYANTDGDHVNSLTCMAVRVESLETRAVPQAKIPMDTIFVSNTGHAEWQR